MGHREKIPGGIPETMDHLQIVIETSSSRLLSVYDINERNVSEIIIAQEQKVPGRCLFLPNETPSVM